MDQDDPILDGEERSKIIARCEDMFSSKRSVYFDVFEFENLIDFYVEENKLNKAMTLLDIALRQHPASHELEVKKAKLLMERNRVHEALPLVEKLIVVDENNPDLYLMKGACLADIGKTKEAILFFEVAVSHAVGADVEEVLYSSALAFIDNGLYREAVSFLKKAHLLNEANKHVLYDLAYSLDRILDYKESVKCYRKYLDLDPYSDNAWYNIGIVYNKLNEYSDAVDAFDYAIAINEEYSSAYFNKANTLANWEKYDLAISVYNEYLEIEEDNVIAMYYIGECYEKLNEFEMALDFYNKVLVVDRKYADAWFGIGIVKYYQDKLDDAKSYMERAIELDSENSEYWLSYGNVVRALGTMPKETIHAYKKATQINPYDPESWLYYADALRLYADVGLSIDVLKKAITYIEDDPEILFTLAAYYYDKNMLDVALKMYLRAVNVDAGSVSVFFSNCTLLEEDKEMFLELIKEKGHNYEF